MGFAKGMVGQIPLSTVDKEIQNCGVGTKLFELMFIDKDMAKNGGYNIHRSRQWEGYIVLQEIAKRDCSVIIFVHNSAKKVIQSKAYVSAAIQAGYKKLVSFIYTSKHRRDGWILDLKEVIRRFSSETRAEKFVNDYGRNWYFCK